MEIGPFVITVNVMVAVSSLDPSERVLIAIHTGVPFHFLLRAGISLDPPKTEQRGMSYGHPCT